MITFSLIKYTKSSYYKNSSLINTLFEFLKTIKNFKTKMFTKK